MGSATPASGVEPRSRGAAGLVTVRRDGVVVIATINRPAKANAVSTEVIGALDTIVAGIEQSAVSGVTRGLVVTGAGDKAFSAGADIANLQGLTCPAARNQMLEGQRVFARLAALPVPVIAAINGVALGGGLELAMACDLRIAAPHALLGQPEITLANIPGWGGTQRLPRLVGRAVAAEMILTGEPITADRAYQVGLVNAVESDPVTAAVALAHRIAEHSPAAVAAAKDVMYVGFAGGMALGLKAEASAVGRLCETTEQHEAVAAFLARKAAQR